MLAYAEKYEIPIIVAINKIDREGADPERVMRELESYGLTPEPLGGTVPCICISALKQTNLK